MLSVALPQCTVEMSFTSQTGLIALFAIMDMSVTACSSWYPLLDGVHWRWERKVFSWLLIRSCTWGRYPRSKKEWPERIRGAWLSAWHSNSSRNSVCSYQPAWKISRFMWHWVEYTQGSYLSRGIISPKLSTTPPPS